MKKIATIFVMICLTLAFTSLSQAAVQDYDLQFIQITNDGTNFVVKVQIKNDFQGWDKLGSSTLRFNFNTSGLDNPTLQTAHAYSGAAYGPMSVTDGGSWASVVITLSAPNTGTAVSTSWNDVATIHFDVIDAGQSSSLAWDHNAANTVAYDDDLSTLLDHGTFTDLDTSLPVALSNFSAETSAQDGITINWRTESETNTAGFNVLRGASSGGNYSKINSTLIPGQGNSSSAFEYSYSDKNVQSGVEYWYKVEEITTTNSSQYYGPISVIGVNTIPDKFELSQNYPNPFNPETTFKYLVAEDSEVTIGVYNLLGKEIRQLVTGNKEAGYYTATWDGRDTRGMDVSSGIYFIRMQANSFSMVRKASLMR